MPFLLALSCGGESIGETNDNKADHDVAHLALELSIGDNSGNSSEYQFASILDIVISRDGTIWVLDGDGTLTGGQAPQLRQYDSKGRFLQQVGREGSGPGEYRAPYGLALMPGGRVALRDQTLADRITVFEPDGALDATWSLPGGLFWIFRGRSPIQADTGGVVWLPFSENLFRSPDPSVSFLRLGGDGTVLDTVPVPPAPEVDREVVRITRDRSVRTFRVPYQPASAWAWSPFGSFAVVGTDQYRIEVLSPPSVPNPGDGASHTPTASLATVVTRDVPPIPVPEAERAALRKRLVERVSTVEGGRGLRIPETPANKPPIKSLSYADDGRLLVRVSMPSMFLEDGWTESRAIDVFNVQGDFTGRIVLPKSFYLVRMRGDHIWGVFRGTYGVESIRRYGVVWP